MDMKRNLLALLMLFALIPGMVLAQNAAMEEIGSRAAKAAMDQLQFKSGDENVLALTDACHVDLGGNTTEGCVKGITNVIGCSIGDGNLYQILRPHWKPLWFFFYDKNSGESAYLQVNEKISSKSLSDIKALKNDEIFSKISKANVNIDYMLNHSAEANNTFNNKSFNGNEFSLIGIANIWAEPGASEEFLQAAAFHDHLCPGVTSGCMIINYVESKLPITDVNAQSYKVIAVPPWCKDDAIQIIWDATVGKTGIYSMALTDMEKSAFNAKYKTDIAGIYVRWNDTSKKGDGMVLGFNWTKMYELTGTDNWKGPAWAPKLVMNMEMMKYWNQPEVTVSTIKEFPVDQDKLSQLQNAGMHPLKVAGVM
jgi:formylmethanofuran dehydrogenase subunit E-like metal-binding protein